jgi:hypothetical protein
MGNIFNDDFRDFLIALNKNDVEYVLVGAYAVILHGYRRTTGDMDIWVNPTEDNYLKITKAFYDFGLPLLEMTKINFLDVTKFDVFSYGRPPVCIDILTAVKGCNFNDAFEQSEIFMEDDLPIRFINLSILRMAKKASGRFKDLDDLDKLAEISS